MNRILNPILSACQFVTSKQEKQKPGQPIKGRQVSCSVPWANFDQKMFGPAFAVYWQTGTQFQKNLNLNPNNYLDVVSKTLNVSIPWVNSLIEFYSARNEFETEVIINLNSKIISSNKFQEILVEEWTGDGISSFEVAQELRKAYPAIKEPPQLQRGRKITDPEVKRNLARNLIHDAEYYEFNFI